MAEKLSASSDKDGTEREIKGESGLDKNVGACGYNIAMNTDRAKL